MISNLGLIIHELKIVSKPTVYEYNHGTLWVTTWLKQPKRWNFIAVRYHWFRHHVNSGEIRIYKFELYKQKLGIFTKLLLVDKFAKMRKLLCVHWIVFQLVVIVIIHQHFFYILFTLLNTSAPSRSYGILG